MRKTFTLFCLVFAAFITTRAQLVESEPNDTLRTANFMPFDSAMSGTTGTYTQLDFFKFVTPSSGTLRVITTVSIAGSANPNPFSMDLVSNQGHIFSSLSVKATKGADAVDTVEWNCLAADTFYLLAHCNFSTLNTYTYSFRLEMVAPGFGNGNEGNRSLQTAANWDPMTAVQGQLGFKRETGNLVEASYYRIVPPAQGALHVYTNAEYSAAGTHALSVSIWNKSGQMLDSLSGAIGILGTPDMDTLTFNCLDADTLYLRVSQNGIFDCGWAYSMMYDFSVPEYGNDAEPNNTFAQASLILPGREIDGHSHYAGDVSEDYFKFFKPDNGFLQIVGAATTTDTSSRVVKMRLYDHAQTLVNTADVFIGSNGEPGAGVLYLDNVPSDTLYVRMSWPNVDYCGSYAFFITTETISDIEDKGLVPVSVMPNPSNGAFTFDLRSIHASELQVYDMNGRLVEYMSGAALKPHFVSVGGQLQAGVYIARLYNGAAISGVVRLVKTGL